MRCGICPPTLQDCAGKIGREIASSDWENADCGFHESSVPSDRLEMAPEGEAALAVRWFSLKVEDTDDLTEEEAEGARAFGFVEGGRICAGDSVTLTNKKVE